MYGTSTFSERECMLIISYVPIESSFGITSKYLHVSSQAMRSSKASPLTAEFFQHYETQLNRRHERKDQRLFIWPDDKQYV